MINQYSSIHLESFDGGHKMFNYAGVDVGAVTFKEELTPEESAANTFVKVKAVVDGVLTEGFINMSTEQTLLGQVKVLSPEEVSKKINDYILFIPGRSIQECEILKGLMHLGIAKERYEADPVGVAKEYVGFDDYQDFKIKWQNITFEIDPDFDDKTLKRFLKALD